MVRKEPMQTQCWREGGPGRAASAPSRIQTLCCLQCARSTNTTYSKSNYCTSKGVVYLVKRPYSTLALRDIECGNGKSSGTPASIFENHGQNIFEYLGFQSRAPTMSSVFPMKDVHYEKPFQASVSEIPVPSIEHPDHVKVKVTTVGMLPTVSIQVEVAGYL